MTHVQLWIPGPVPPKGSPVVYRAGGRLIVRDQQAGEIAGWEDLVGAAWNRKGIPLQPRSPVALRVTIWVRRPPSHYTGRGALTKSAPLYPTVKPDLDKQLRTVLDSLTGLAYRDDAQVVSITARARYSDTHPNLPGPGCRIALRWLDLEDPS